MFSFLSQYLNQWLEACVNWQLSIMLSKNSAGWDRCADSTLLFMLLVLSLNIISLPHTLPSPDPRGLSTSLLPWRDGAGVSSRGSWQRCYSNAPALTDWRTKRWEGGEEGNQPLLSCSLKTWLPAKRLPDATFPSSATSWCRVISSASSLKIGSFQEHQNYFQGLYSSRTVHKCPSWLSRALRGWEARFTRGSLHLLSPWEKAEAPFPARVPSAWLRLLEFSTDPISCHCFFQGLH